MFRYDIATTFFGSILAMQILGPCEDSEGVLSDCHLLHVFQLNWSCCFFPPGCHWTTSHTTHGQQIQPLGHDGRVCVGGASSSTYEGVPCHGSIHHPGPYFGHGGCDHFDHRVFGVVPSWSISGGWSQNYREGPRLDALHASHTSWASLSRPPWLWKLCLVVKPLGFYISFGEKYPIWQTKMATECYFAFDKHESYQETKFESANQGRKKKSNMKSSSKDFYGA